MPKVGDPLFGSGEPREAYIPWAELMKRVRKVDVLQCFCNGRRKVVGYVMGWENIREGLEKLGLGTGTPEVAKARRQPQDELFDRRPDSDGVDPPSPDFAA
jgi:hypothetical protein